MLKWIIHCTFNGRSRTPSKYGNANVTKEEPTSGKEYIKVTSMHVSCKSDTFSYYSCGPNLAGIVLYNDGYGRTDWYCNGIHCKSGYIILKNSDKSSFKGISGEGQVHGAVYKSVFEQNIPSKMVGGCFARYKNEWKYNGNTFNARNNGYTDGSHSMHSLEIDAVKTAVQNYIYYGKQNTQLPRPLYIEEN